MSAETSVALDTYTCPNCGATTAFDPASRTLRCPFCGTEIAVRSSGAAKQLPSSVPQYVLPFTIDKDASAMKVREWLGDSFFAPKDLKSRSALDRGQGTYVAFWRFDADAESDWEGEVSQTLIPDEFSVPLPAKAVSEKRAGRTRSIKPGTRDPVRTGGSTARSSVDQAG